MSASADERGDSHGHSHGAAFDSDRMAGVLEVEGEAARSLTEEAIALSAALLDDAALPVRRVIDIGCGPGIATTSLAEAFPSATVLAVDGSVAMLERATARAARLGYSARVETRQLELTGALRVLDRCDLAWAAMAIHHVDDEIGVLGDIRSLVNPGGLLCLLERAEPLGVNLGRDLGRPGIWNRLEAARRRWFESVREGMPGAAKAEAYPSMLAAAGFELIVERTLVVAADAGHDDATRRFLVDQLHRTAKDLAHFLDESDREALQVLSNDAPTFSDSLWRDAKITVSRKLFIARPSH